MKEATEGQVDLVEDEPEIVKLMIQYFYELDYRIPGLPDEPPLSVRFQSEHPINGADLDWRRSFATGLANLNEEAMAAAVKVTHKHTHGVAVRFVTSRKAYVKTNSEQLSGRTHVLNPYTCGHRSGFGKELRNIIDNEASTRGTPWKPIAARNAPIVHAKMYAIAEQYQIEGLKELAVDKFIAASEDHFTNEGFYDAIDIVYTTTVGEDLRLRDVVAKYICDDIEVYGLHSRAEEKLQSVPDLAFRVMKMHFGPKGCGVEGRS